MRSSKAEVDRSHALTGDTVEYAGIYATDYSILTLSGVRVKVSIIRIANMSRRVCSQNLDWREAPFLGWELFPLVIG